MSLKDIFSSPMWNAGVAIGTIALAFATFMSIYTAKKERKIRLDREIMDEIYNPLIKDLRGIKIDLERSTTSYHYPWNWEILKDKQETLIYELPKEIFDELEDFTLEFRRYENLRRQLEVKLIQVVEKEEKKKVPRLASEGVWGVCFRGRVGGELCQANLFQLLFRNETFDQYIERFIREKPVLPNKRINGDFMVLNTSTRLSKEDFEEINASVKKAVNDDPQLRQLIDEGKTIHKNAGSLENKINIVVRRRSSRFYR